MFDAKLLGARASLSAGLVSVLLAVGAGAGCTDQRAPAGATAATSAAAPGSNAGSIQIALQVPPSVQLGTFSYQITRGAYSQSGAIDVSHAATVNGVIGGIPVGTGYALALSASDPSGKLTGCSGTANFDVSAGVVTSVPIDVVCHLAPTTPPPPSVPIPYPAVVVLAGALLGAGLGGSGRSRRGR
jgi:hypothetical protein